LPDRDVRRHVRRHWQRVGEPVSTGFERPEMRLARTVTGLCLGQGKTNH